MEKQPSKEDLYHQAEFLVNERLEGLKFEDDGYSFKLKLEGERMICTRRNTTLYAFHEDYSIFNHVRVEQQQGLPFFIFLCELDQELAVKLVEHMDKKEYDVVYAYNPIDDPVTAEVYYNYLRGDDTIEEIIEEIINE